MESKSLSLKPIIKLLTFRLNFCLGGISNGFGATDSKEESLKGNVCNFSVDYNAIDTSDILKIHKYLMLKNNMKYCLDLLNKCLLDYKVLVDYKVLCH